MLSSRLPSYSVAFGLLFLLTACSYDSDYRYPTELPGPVSVDVAFCADARPAWVAFQDGDGAWQRMIPQVGERLATVHLSVHDARGGVAVARDHGSGISSLSVRYGKAQELAGA